MNQDSKRWMGALFVALFVFLCLNGITPNTHAQGLSGGLGKAGKNDHKPDDWKKESPFEPKKEKPENIPRSAEPSKNADPPSATKDKPKEGKKTDAPQVSPTVDQRIDALKEKISKLKKKRGSTQLMDDIASVKDAAALIEKYEKLLEAAKKSGGRKSDLDKIRRELQEAKKLVQNAQKNDYKNKPISLRRDLNIINRELLDVYIASRQMRLRDWQWRREMKHGEFVLRVRPKSLQLQLAAWEDEPMLDKLPRDGGSLRAGLQDVKNLLGGSEASKRLLATMSVPLRVAVWQYQGRQAVLRIRTNPNSRSVPRIPSSMKKKSQLRAEAAELDTQFLPYFEIELTLDQRQQLRENGRLIVPMGMTSPIRGLNHWVLLDSANVQVELMIDKTDESASKPKPGPKPDGKRRGPIIDGELGQSQWDLDKTDVQILSPKRKTPKRNKE